MFPSDQEFRLYSLLHGETSYSPLLLTQIPSAVGRELGWNARNVFVTTRDAQKIRYHPMHGMDGMKGLALPMVIRRGDYYQSNKRGTHLQIEIVLHQPDNPKRAYFLVLARDKIDQGIFIRTFYFTAELSRNKMKDATEVLVQGTSNFFR